MPSDAAATTLCPKSNRRDEAPDAQLEAAFDQAMLAFLLDRVRAEVHPRTYQAFEAFALGGCSGAEAARLTGLTPNAVYQARKNILRRLRELGAAFDRTRTARRNDPRGDPLASQRRGRAVVGHADRTNHPAARRWRTANRVERAVRMNKIDPPQAPDFDFVRPIGEGGFGQVWLAINRTTGQPRAVKVIPRAGANGRDPAGREIASLTRLEANLCRRHPNLLVIHHVGETAEHLFYVMDLADDLSGQADPTGPDYRPATLENLLGGRPARCGRLRALRRAVAGRRWLACTRPAWCIAT